MGKAKLLLPVVLLVVGLVGGKMFLAPKPVETTPPPKVEGKPYVLPKDFLINLQDGRFAKVSVALILKEHYLEEAVAEASGGGHGAPKLPDGYGELPQEAVVRDIITDELTGAHASDLINKKQREELKKHIKERLHENTDVEVKEVMLTDVAVQ